MMTRTPRLAALSTLAILLIASGCAAPTESDDGSHVMADEPTDEQLEITPGPNMQFADSTPSSVEEWEKTEGVMGDEFDALFGDEVEQTGGTEIRFIGSVGKMFGGINFQVSRGIVPGGFASAGIFSARSALPNDPFKGATLAFAGMPFGSALQRLATALVLAVQIQGAIRVPTSLRPVPAAQAAKLVELFGGVAADYGVSLPATFSFANATKVDNRIYVDKRKNKPVVIRNLTTSGGSTTVFDIPRGAL